MMTMYVTVLLALMCEVGKRGGEMHRVYGRKGKLYRKSEGWKGKK